VDYAPPVLESIQHFIGKDFQSSKITVLEGLFSSNLQFLQEGFPQLLDSTSARFICVLLENLLVSNNFTQNELVIAVFAIASAVTQCFSHASTTMETIIQEREESKSNENSNAEEIETLQLNFYSLQKKCSSLMQIHENYKEEKELQIQEALQQCSRLKQQVEEAASYNFRQDDEIKRLTLALSQTEKAMDAGIVSSDVEKSR
jgi:DNA-binding PucR family transcriptional regulator